MYVLDFAHRDVRDTSSMLLYQSFLFYCVNRPQCIDLVNARAGGFQRAATVNKAVRNAPTCVFCGHKHSILLRKRLGVKLLGHEVGHRFHFRT